jgi:hypothetical protein
MQATLENHVTSYRSRDVREIGSSFSKAFDCNISAWGGKIAPLVLELTSDHGLHLVVIHSTGTAARRDDRSNLAAR